MTAKPKNCGNFDTTVSAAEAVSGFFRCTCGRIVKIRPRRDNTTFIPPHNKPKEPGTKSLSSLFRF